MVVVESKLSLIVMVDLVQFDETDNEFIILVGFSVDLLDFHLLVF